MDDLVVSLFWETPCIYVIIQIWGFQNRGIPNAGWFFFDTRKQHAWFGGAAPIFRPVIAERRGSLKIWFDTFHVGIPNLFESIRWIQMEANGP